MKKLFAASALACLLSLALPLAGGAQTVVLQSTNSRNTDGVLVGNATVTATPVLCGSGAPVSVRAMPSKGQISMRPVTTNFSAPGVFSLFLLDVQAVLPPNIGYHVVVADSLTGEAYYDYPCMQPSDSGPAVSGGPGVAWCTAYTAGPPAVATTCDFDLYPPSYPAQAPYTPGPAGAPGGVGATGSSGVNVVSGVPDSPTSIFNGHAFRSTSPDPFLYLPPNGNPDPKPGQIWQSATDGKLYMYKNGAVMSILGSGDSVGGGVQSQIAGLPACILQTSGSCIFGATNPTSGVNGFCMDTQYHVMGGCYGRAGDFYMQANTPGDSANGGSINMYGSANGRPDSGGAAIYATNLLGVYVDGNAAGHHGGYVGVGYADGSVVPFPLSVNSAGAYDTTLYTSNPNAAGNTWQSVSTASGGHTWALINGGPGGTGLGAWKFYDVGTGAQPLIVTQTGIMSGSATAPTGRCYAVGWDFSQDGHASYCNATTWVTKF